MKSTIPVSFGIIDFASALCCILLLTATPQASAGPAKISATDAKLVTEIMAFSDDELLKFVPTQTPFISSDCPGGGKFYDRGIITNSKNINWELVSPGNPSQIRCIANGKVFPGDFPINHQETFLTAKGESITVDYYKDADGKLYALPGMLQSWQHLWLVQHLSALSKAYAATKDESYAKRIVAVFSRYAEVVPHYLLRYFKTETNHLDNGEPTQRNSYYYVSTGGPYLVNGEPHGEPAPESLASDVQPPAPYNTLDSFWGWGRWDTFPSEMTDIYESVLSSPSLSPTQHERIVNGFFGEIFRYVATFPMWYHINNNAGRLIPDLLHAGRLFVVPEWVHFGNRWIENVLYDYAFSRDHIFGESPGYFGVFMDSHSAAFNEIAGYSDPPGYNGEYGPRIVNSDGTGPMAFLHDAFLASERIRFPNGSLLPLGDNRHNDFVDPLFRIYDEDEATIKPRGKPLEASSCVLMPGYGHAVLGAGSGDQQIQAHLQFSKFSTPTDKIRVGPDTGPIHTHRDGLSLMLWAFGSELFTDIGYHKSGYRIFSGSTLAHNTVVIDRKNQGGDSNKGDVLLNLPEKNGISMIQVEDHGAYDGVATRYRRTLILNSRNPNAPYLVDVFEVKGGSVHDYVLHGPTIYDSVATTNRNDLKLMTNGPVLEGLARPLLEPTDVQRIGNKDTDYWSARPVGPIKPENPSYGVFTNVNTSAGMGDFFVTFTLKDPFGLPNYFRDKAFPIPESFHYAADPAFYSAKLDIGVRTHVVNGPGNRVLYLGESPSLLRSGLLGGSLTEEIKRPSMILRNKGADGLSTVFVMVHEPFYGAPQIVSVRRKKIVEGPANSVALEITQRTGTDTVLLSLEGEQTVKTEDAMLKGIAGFVSKPKAGEPAALLIAGTQLSQGTTQLANSTGGYKGILRKIESQLNGDPVNAFVISGDSIPAGDSLRGQWMHLSLGTMNRATEPAAVEAFEIDHVENHKGLSRVFLKEDPGATLNRTVYTEKYYPRRSFNGYVFTFVPTSVGR